jgi:hypothetical protein
MAKHQSTTTSMLVVLALLAVTGLQSTAAVTCNAGDKAALVAFKAAIKTDPTGILSSWTTTTDCCTWENVYCDSTGRVYELSVRPDPAFDDSSIYMTGMDRIIN